MAVEVDEGEAELGIASEGPELNDVVWVEGVVLDDGVPSLGEVADTVVSHLPLLESERVLSEVLVDDQNLEPFLAISDHRRLVVSQNQPRHREPPVASAHVRLPQRLLDRQSHLVSTELPNHSLPQTRRHFLSLVLVVVSSPARIS